MIDHHAYRRAIMADPHGDDAELREHRDSCPECRAYAEALLRFEARLERAFNVNIPEPAAKVLPFAAAASRRAAPTPRAKRWLALAASVVFGVVLGSVIWLAAPRTSLAADVVAHMAGEPEAWHTRQPVPEPELQAVLRDSKMQLNPAAGTVSYASSCSFRGHHVPHLVVQTPDGPVTVMVLVNEPVKKSEQFDEQGYRGTIVPVPGHGSLAVLMRGSGTDRAEIDDIAARVRGAIVWAP